MPQIHKDVRYGSSISGMMSAFQREKVRGILTEYLAGSFGTTTDSHSTKAVVEAVMEETGADISRKKGRYSKRLSSILWKNHRVKMDPKVLTELGNATVDPVGEYELDVIVSDDMEQIWTPAWDDIHYNVPTGNFSCFAPYRKNDTGGANRHIFDNMKRHGGFKVVMLYDGDMPVARSFLYKYPHANIYLVFNAYSQDGSIGNETIAHAITNAWEIPDGIGVSAHMWRTSNAVGYAVPTNKVAIAIGADIDRIETKSTMWMEQSRDDRTCSICGIVSARREFSTKHSACFRCIRVYESICMLTSETLAPDEEIFYSNVSGGMFRRNMISEEQAGRLVNWRPMTPRLAFQPESRVLNAITTDNQERDELVFVDPPRESPNKTGGKSIESEYLETGRRLERRFFQEIADRGDQEGNPAYDVRIRFDPNVGTAFNNFGIEINPARLNEQPDPEHERIRRINNPIQPELLAELENIAARYRGAGEGLQEEQVVVGQEDEADYEYSEDGEGDEPLDSPDEV